MDKHRRCVGRCESCVGRFGAESEKVSEEWPKHRVRAFVAICGGGVRRGQKCLKYAEYCKFIRQNRAQKTVKKISRRKQGAKVVPLQSTPSGGAGWEG